MARLAARVAPVRSAVWALRVNLVNWVPAQRRLARNARVAGQELQAVGTYSLVSTWMIRRFCPMGTAWVRSLAP
jgi:hypothetical protein